MRGSCASLRTPPTHNQANTPRLSYSVIASQTLPLLASLPLQRSAVLTVTRGSTPGTSEYIHTPAAGQTKAWLGLLGGVT